MTELWWKKDKNGIEFLSGNLDAATKVMVLPNIDKTSKQDPDYFLYMGSMAEADDAATVKVSDMAKRRISASDLVKDFRKGMGASELMKKYHVSLKDLHKLFEKLVAARRLAQSDIDGRFPEYKKSTIEKAEKKRSKRKEGADP